MTGTENRQIAFLGTGLMGAPMARRLLAAGINPFAGLDGLDGGHHQFPAQIFICEDRVEI